MTIHTVVTTFHREGYEKYGKKMIQTYMALWPKNVHLHVYAEDTHVTERAPNISVHDIGIIGELTEFKKRYRDDPRANGTLSPGGMVPPPKEAFKWDAVRFSNKVFSVAHAMKHCTTDCLIWLDADTITHTQITTDFLDSIAPIRNEAVTYLNRKHWPECGWVGYNMNHPLMGRFITEWTNLYTSGNFLRIPESHDSYTFWKMTKRFSSRFPNWKERHIGNSEEKGHVFINSILGDYMDHLKGPRKDYGKSFAKDLKTTRKESWWQDLK